MDQGSAGIENQARAALQASPVHALRDLQIEMIDDAILISGRVSSFYHKQLAQEAIRSVTNDIHVVNKIDVTYDELS